ncbi:MAG: C40 family peptidase [candidate division Zixibacteria bacterium]|nr:C40 family peptidase [candidate division Zixibacteria bacterium]
MKSTRISKKWFLKTALSYLGTPYIWGGDDPSGFDCSGLVVECLKSAGLLSENKDFTADDLLRHFQPNAVELPRSGALLFRIDCNGRAGHVAICLDRYFKIEAAGGGSGTTDPSKAWRDNAYVRIRPLHFNPTWHRVVYPFAD